MYSWDYYYSPYDTIQPRGDYSAAITGGVAGLFAGALAIMWFVIMILGVIYLIGLWKTFKKANVDGWEALIPIHNVVVEFKLAGIKTYWIFVLFVPFANIIVYCWKAIKLAKAYGKDTGFGIGLILLPWLFIPILGLGKAKYIGVQDDQNSNVNTRAKENASTDSNININSNSDTNEDGSINAKSDETENK